MVIVAIKGDDIGTNEVVIGSVVILVFSEYGVTGEGFSCRLLVGQIDLAGIEAVGCVASALGSIDGHSFVFLHFECSFLFLLVGNGCG